MRHGSTCWSMNSWKPRSASRRRRRGHESRLSPFGATIRLTLLRHKITAVSLGPRPESVFDACDAGVLTAWVRFGQNIGPVGRVRLFYLHAPLRVMAGRLSRPPTPVTSAAA